MLFRSRSQALAVIGALNGACNLRVLRAMDNLWVLSYYDGLVQRDCVVHVRAIYLLSKYFCEMCSCFCPGKMMVISLHPVCEFVTTPPCVLSAIQLNIQSEQQQMSKS
ncbi:hypothetical protein ABZP36_028118 [Zizania latifolia]